ncbi:MAG: helix-turn-helix transcriptional regulator [Veillonellales bacterium]
MELDYIQIGQRLKIIRGKISLTSFGDQFGYSYSYVRSCEHGKKPSLEYLHAIVDFFGISMNWLIYGLGPRSYYDCQEMQKVETIFDPDLKRMFGILKELMESGDQNLRGWAIIQFEEAFKKQCAAAEEKKQDA